MSRLGYTRYVAQGGDQGAGVTDAIARQAPDGLLGVHFNFLGGPRELLMAALNPGSCSRTRTGSSSARSSPSSCAATSPRWASTRRRSATRCWTHRSAWPHGCSTTTRQLREDLAGLPRRGAYGRPHAGQRPRQHHALLGDEHVGLCRAAVLGGRTERKGRSSIRRLTSSSQSATPCSRTSSSSRRGTG